jgi:hypothetical protein
MIDTQQQYIKLNIRGEISIIEDIFSYLKEINSTFKDGDNVN